MDRCVTVGRFVTALSAFICTDFAFGQCELAKVEASDRAPHDDFGAAVAMDGDFVVVGAPGAERVGRDFVPSYVFQRVGSTWIEHTILDPADISPRSQFGRSVAISGDVIVVGAIIDGHSEPFQFDGLGSAYVYRFDGTAWNEEAKLTASDAARGNFFGASVAISGNRIVIGASGYGRKDSSTGAVYVFEHDGAEWTERVKLTASDAQGYDFFGYTVATDGQVIVVGALNDGHTEPDSTDGTGAAYVFRFDWQGWNEEQKLTVGGLSARAWLGRSVSISGDLILIGAAGADITGNNSGAAYVFRREGCEWIYESRLLGKDTQASDRFGHATALRGDLALVGAYFTDWGVGTAYVFQRNGNAWSQVAKLNASDGFSQHRFGSAVALDADIVAVGAVGGQGSAYFYKILDASDCNSNTINDACETDCNQNRVPDDCDITDGTSVDCNGNGIPDECELDCNENDVSDDCDIKQETSSDCNTNGIPDECEVDCNGNDVPDECDIADKTSDDCNANHVPDDCEPDCNENGVADSCDIEIGTSEDCNRNIIPDTCEPNEDCNGNGVQDICDIADGTSDDCNETGIPDECEIAGGRLFAADLPGLVGVYGGFAGPYGGGSEYAFDHQFAIVRKAWMRVRVTTYFQGNVVGLKGCLDGVCKEDWHEIVSYVESCVPLMHGDAALDGIGAVRVSVLPPCCDQQAGITDATLWFDAVPLPAPTNLRDFARFQACFGGKDVGPPDPCDPLDYDRDDEVDLDDYDIFRLAFTGPK